MGLARKPTRMTHTDLAVLQREIRQLIERMADFDRVDRPGEGEWVPPVDVYEYRGRLVVVVEVPGLTPDALRIVHGNKQLVISGERKERRASPAVDSFLCMERPQGRFRRTIPFDFSVDVSLAEARLAAGVLTITLPRLKDRRGQQIVIQAQRDQAGEEAGES
jgi:HSP20 family protein